MNRRLLVSLAPLLTIVALAAMPVAAQALEPHWYKSETVIKAGVRTPFVLWGKTVNLSFQSPAAEMNCRTVGAGTDENPAGGGAGTSKLDALAFYECKTASCEKAGAELGVPTTAEMFVNPRAAINGFLSGKEVEGKEVDEYYLDFTPVAPFTERCVTPPGYEPHTTFGEFSFTGTVWPYVGPGWNGTAPSKPSEMYFNGQASGSLTGEIGEAWFDGSLKYLGYNGQELLSVGK